MTHRKLDGLLEKDDYHLRRESSPAVEGYFPF